MGHLSPYDPSNPPIVRDQTSFFPTEPRMTTPEVEISVPDTALRRRRIGVADIVFFVVAASAPLTVTAGGMPQSLAATGVVGQPPLYAGLAVVLIVFSVGYAAMSRYISNAGAFYAYIGQGLGRPFGTAAAFVALLAYNTMQIGIYGLFGFTTADFLKTKLKLDLPWWTMALAGVAVVALLGYRRVDLNARVLAVLLTVESLTVLVFDIAQFGDAPSGVSLKPFTLDAVTTGSTGAAICFVMAAFMGFESAAIYGEECRDPERTIPRATYIAVLLIGVFYAVTAWAMTAGAGVDQVVGQARRDGPGMVFALAGSHVGGAFADLAQVFLITSLFAALLSFHNAVARYFFSLGREGVLPRALGRTHPRHGSPHVGSVTQTVLAGLVVGLFAALGKDPMATLFNWFTNLGALGVILLLVATSASVIGFFGRRSEPVAVWNRLIAPALATVALSAVFVMCLTNFGALLGAESGSPLRWILPGSLFVAAVVGVGFGLYLRAARPGVYQGIGHGGER